MIHFTIEDNFSFDETKGFVRFYKKCKEVGDIVNVETGEVDHHICFSLQPIGETDKVEGEVDAIFLSYLILFLSDYTRATVEFNFLGTARSDRAFSLRIQLEYMIKILGLEPSRIILSGQYQTNDGAIKRISIRDKLEISSKLIPPIFLSDATGITTYFSNNSFKTDENLLALASGYWKSVERVLAKTALSLKIQSHNLVEVYLLSLIIVQQNKVEDSRELSHIVKYVRKLATGLKQLAENVVTHSSFHKGVITARVYERRRLEELKTDVASYFEETGNDIYLDLNVVDFGSHSIRETYKTQLESDSQNHDFTELDIDFEKDIEIIGEQTIHSFKDFFVYNVETAIDHQRNRLISRFGLQYFTYVVKNELNGYIKSASHQEGVILFGDKVDTVGEFLGVGTNYNCIVPIDWSFLKSRNQAFQDVDNEDGIPAESLLSLYDISLSNIGFDETTKKPLPGYDTEVTIYSPPISTVIDVGNGKRQKVGFVHSQLLEIQNHSNLKILAIDAKGLNQIDESDWLRLLAEASLHFKDIIVFDIDVSLTSDLIHICSVTSKIKEFSFWDSSSKVLFYSFKTPEYDSRPELDIRRYGATLLTGTTVEEYVSLNKSIWKHRYSFFPETIQDYFDNSVEAIQGSNLNKGPLFRNGKLVYFELALKVPDHNGRPMTLFEKSIQYSLNTPLDLDKKGIASNNQGYKIGETHFRLGSKIHIRDFFYAKRMFQNSFFTTPFAYLLSKKVLDLVEEKKLKEITLVGYETYSDFLVSTARHLLEKKLGKAVKVNHASFSNNILSRELSNLNSHVILITPIASSFSTSIKVQNQIIELIKKENRKSKTQTEFGTEDVHIPTFVEPYINMVLVGNYDFEAHGQESSQTKTIKFRDDSMEKRFGWNTLNIDEHLVEVESFAGTNKKLIGQYYFLPVYTDWHEVETCELCFPTQDIVEGQTVREECLIETGSASITPNLIFGLPKTKSSWGLSKRGEVRKLDFHKSLLYGNIKNDRNRYLYYNRMGQLLKQNRPDVEQWLRDEVAERFAHIRDKKVVIVTPSSSSKSGFLDLVNELVFDYSANCIAVALAEDYIENSETLYADGLHRAEVIIYVDDVLSTINSFIATNYIVKQISRKLKTGRGIDYCIALVNRMSFDNEDNLLLKLVEILPDVEVTETDDTTSSMTKVSVRTKDRLIYFTKLNNPTIEEANNDFPLDIELKRYKKLVEISSLDSIRQIFSNKAVTIRRQNISKKPIDDGLKDWLHNDKKLYQMLVLDTLYTAFEESNRRETNLFWGKKVDFETGLVSWVRKELQKDTKHKRIIDFHDPNLKFVILKLLCSVPLVYYQQVRISVFNWVTLELDILLNSTKSSDFDIMRFFRCGKIGPAKYEIYSDFQKLKFLLKRSVQLKSNFIFHPNTLALFRNLITKIQDNESAIKKERDENQKDIELAAIYLYSRTELPINKEKIRTYLNVCRVHKHIEKQTYDSAIEQLHLLDSKSKRDDYEMRFDDKFDKEFDKLRNLPRHSTASIKGFVYHLVALVQELIFDHETKAIKLENNVNLEIRNNRLAYIGAFDHGGFYHYLRLLKLENTAAIDRFWDYFVKEERDDLISTSDGREIRFETVLSCLKNHAANPRYKSIESLLLERPKLTEEIEVSSQSFNPFLNFLLLRSKMHSWTKSKNSSEETIVDEVHQILKLTTRIVGINETTNKGGAFFTLNYLNKRDPQLEDLFMFDPYTSAKPETMKVKVSNVKSHNSLTYKMFQGVKSSCGEFLLSNLEVIGNGDAPNFRNGVWFEPLADSDFEAEKSVECVENNEYNVLLIRISSFPKDSEIGNQFGQYPQAVLTYFMEKGERISEENLRLLLLLRRNIGKFIEENLYNNTFLEFLENRKNRLYQKYLRHDLGKYLRKQAALVEAKALYEGDNPRMFQVFNNAILGQLGAYDVSDSEDLTVSNEEFSEYVKMILRTKLIGAEFWDSDADVIIEFENVESNVLLPSLIYEVVLPQLLINIKNYAHQINPEIRVSVNPDGLVLTNKVRSNIPHRDRKGLLMCKSICDELRYGFEYSTNSSDNQFKVTIFKQSGDE